MAQQTPRPERGIRRFAHGLFGCLGALIFALSLCAPAQGAGGAELLRYGGDQNFRPFEFVDAAGRPQGFQIELLAAIERVAGLKFSVRLDDWEKVEADFRRGELDAIAMSHARSREQWASFVRSHATPAIAVYHRTDGPAPVSLADLEGKRIAVAESEPMRDTQEAFFPDTHYHFETFASPNAALQAVRDGNADYALIPRAYGDRVASSIEGIADSGLNLLLQSYGFAVLPGNAQLRDALDRALNELDRTGELEALRVKWLSSHRSKAVRYALEGRIAWQWIGMGMIALGGGGALAWFAVKLRRRGRQARQERDRRRLAESELEATREKLERAFTNHPDAMVITAFGSGIILDANQALCRLVGVRPEALLGQSLDGLAAMVAPAAVTILRGLLHHEGAVDSAPIEIRRSDGATRSCLVSAEVIAVAGEQQVFSIIRDVTEQLQANAELRSGYQALAESLREQSQELATTRADLAKTDEELQNLASSISHDLRAPLRAIRGFSGMLKEDLEAGRIDEAAFYVAHIDRAAQRMDEMIQALARLARSAHGSLTRTAIDMGHQAQEAWSLVTAGEPAQRCEFVMGELPPAHGDASLVTQVWQNLLANAFKYSSRRTGAKVGVDAFSEGRRQWYRVTDNGAGFDMNHAKRLFEPFHRLHREADFVGTGMGLNIVRRIVRRHGGDIRARGTVGVGAVFEFTLAGEADNPNALKDGPG